MSRILKRPMFRRGGSSNEGIMTGLVDRKGYQEDGFVTSIGQKAAELTPELVALLEKYTPKTPFRPGAVGARLLRGEGFRESLIEPYLDYTKRDDAREAAIKGGAAKLAIGQALKVPKDSRTSLMKELQAAGYIPGTAAYQKALRLRTLGEGTIGFSDFQSKVNVDKATTAGNYASESIDFLTSVAELGAKSPDAFGLKGKILGFAKDVSTEVEGLHDSSLRSAAKDFGIEAGVYDDLKNPDFSKIGPLENALSIRLARTRNPRDRLMKDMIRDAKKDTSLSGLGGATKVRDRLPTIFKEFLDTATNKYRAAGKTEAEIGAILNPKIKAFNDAMNKLSGIKPEGDDSFDEGFKMPTKGEDGVYRFLTN